MDSLIFELQIVFYFQFFLSANVRYTETTVELRDKWFGAKTNYSF